MRPPGCSLFLVTTFQYYITPAGLLIFGADLLITFKYTQQFAHLNIMQDRLRKQEV